MIHSINEINTNEKTYPFTSAARYLDLAAYGYEEKEYYVRGTANVYESVGNTGQVQIKHHDCEYVNRIIVRKPIRKSSGNVVVEIINPTSFMEIERMWILGYQKFMRDGDIYVGITSKPNTIKKLLEFDHDRYAPLDWSNPTPDVPFDFDEKDIHENNLLPDLDLSYEPGLFWDMLHDLAVVLRSDDHINPIHDLDHKYIYLTGWSQSACYLFRYINSFDSSVFDGYLAGGGVRNLIVPVNQYESMMNYDFRLSRVEWIDRPFISIQTESENGQFNAFRTKRKDSDNPHFMYREYEVTGSSHDTMFSYVNYYQNDPDLIRIDHLPTYIGKEKEGNDYPSQYLFMAGFKNLFRWVIEGVGPGHCERIKMDEYGNNCKDAFGNTIGGLRTCLLNYPTGVYSSFSTVEPGQSFVDPTSCIDPLFGHQKAFSASMLKELYGSLDNYRQLCLLDTKEQVSKGFILKEDAPTLVEFALNLAAKRGLK